MTTKSKAKAKSPADNMRSKLLAKGRSQVKDKKMPLMGTTVLVKVLSFEAIFNMQQAFTDTLVADDANAMDKKIADAKHSIRLFIACTYDINTGKRLFKDSDIDEILSWPYNQEITNIIETVDAISNFDAKGAEKKSS